MDQWENPAQVVEEELKFDDINFPPLVPEEVKDKDPDNIYKSTGLFPRDDVDKPIPNNPGIEKNEPVESPNQINNLLETPQSLDLDYDKINEMAEKIA